MALDNINPLGILQFESATPVLRRSQLLDWCSWGVRDIAIASNLKGNFLRENGKLVQYFTGSCESGKRQQTGRAVSSDGGKTWTIAPETPVIPTSDHDWDRQIAATPWVIHDGEQLRLYYRGAYESGVGEGIGLATSQDGIDFKKHPGNPILTTRHFAGLRDNPTVMGVTNVIRTHEERFILLFEGVEAQHEQRGQIFAALSDDGTNFRPMNDGFPIFSARNVSSWPVKAVCNPRLTALNDGWYMLGFNGSFRGEYSIGIAYTRDFRHWHEHPQNPLLIPRGWPPEDPFTNRLEGPVFDRETLLSDAQDISIYIMSIPVGARNHENAVNALVKAKRIQPIKATLNIRALPVHANSIELIGKRITLRANTEPSSFVQAHHVAHQPVRVLSIKASAPAWSNGEVYIGLSNSLNSLPAGSATTLRITQSVVMIRNPAWSRPSKNIAVRAVRRLYRSLRRRNRLPCVPADGWRTMCKLPESDHPVRIMIRTDIQTPNLEVIVNDCSIVLHDVENDIDFRVVTFGCFRTDADIHVLGIEC